MRREVRIAGFGGQGVILAGVILAEAAGVYEDKEVVQTQSYGPEARGGAARAEVIISDERITYIKAVSPDILLALSQPALDRYLSDIDRSRALVLVDRTIVNSWPSDVSQFYAIPATRLAEEILGKRIVANIVMLGAMAALSDIVALSSLQKALIAQLPPSVQELNLRALELGFQEGQRAKAGKESLTGCESL